jgi:hypothetical protein
VSDILAEIDAVIAAAEQCLCGCGRPIKPSGPSPWFASQECQEWWNAQPVRNVTRETWPPLDVPLPAARPPAASPYLTWRDITGRAPEDEVVQAFRAEVRRQGLDESTIRVEALRPADAPADSAPAPRPARRRRWWPW